MEKNLQRYIDVLNGQSALPANLNLDKMKAALWRDLGQSSADDVQLFAASVVAAALNDASCKSPTMADITKTDWQPNTTAFLRAGLHVLSTYASYCLMPCFGYDAAVANFSEVAADISQQHETHNIQLPPSNDVIWHPIFLKPFFEKLEWLQGQREVGEYYANPQNAAKDGFDAQVAPIELITQFDYGNKVALMNPDNPHPLLSHLQAGYNAALAQECMGEVNQVTAQYFHEPDGRSIIIGKLLMPQTFVKTSQLSIKDNAKTVGITVDFTDKSQSPTVQQYADAFVRSVGTQQFHVGLWGAGYQSHWQKCRYPALSNRQEYKAVTEYALQKAVLNALHIICPENQVLRAQYKAALSAMPLDCLKTIGGRALLELDPKNNVNHAKFYADHLQDNTALQTLIKTHLAQAFTFAQQYLNHR